MTIWFVSRHPGALQWMQRSGTHFDRHVSHLDTHDIQGGDTIIGSLPVNLAAEVCQRGAHYINLSLHLPESARGRELSADELGLFEAVLESFEVRKTNISPLNLAPK